MGKKTRSPLPSIEDPLWRTAAVTAPLVLGLSALVFGVATEVLGQSPAIGVAGGAMTMKPITWPDVLLASALPPVTAPILCRLLTRFTRYPLAAFQIFGLVVLVASFQPILMSPVDATATRATLGLLHLAVGIPTLIAFSRPLRAVPTD